MWHTNYFQPKVMTLLKPLDQTLKVGIFVCPGYFLGDVVGVQPVFGCSPITEIHLVWKTLDPIDASPRWPTMATITFEECPDIDVLAVGLIPPDVIADPEVIAFFQQKSKSASAVIGSCGGSLMLGAAALLEGRRATASMAFVDALEDLGAIPVPGGQVVVDGKFYTAGPATGSFEAALIALAALRGEEIAKVIELGIEYDPHPPFKVGSPELAGPELTEQALGMYREAADACIAAARSAYEAYRGRPL